MGRIDVHSHLLPGVDDGCDSLAESIGCARMLEAAGYSYAFCTPHIWVNQTHLARDNVPTLVHALQASYNEAGVKLKVLPGGELNIHPTLTLTPPERIIDLGLGGRYVLVDMWADKLPEWFEPSIRWLQEKGLTVILGHPERMRVVQDHPELADYFHEIGLLLQGNLQCFADRPESYTRRTAQRFLAEDRYFSLGSDTHNMEGLRTRLVGLRNAIEFGGEELIDTLTIHNPQKLLP